jgi:thiazole synthase ThiGH ThiG subunit
VIIDRPPVGPGPTTADPFVAADPFLVGGQVLSSRLILGTGGAANMAELESAVRASGAAMVTVALRRVLPGTSGSVIDVCDRAGVRVLPNTAGCYTWRDAVRTAEAAREAFETDWVKLEVIADDTTLRPGAWPAPAVPRSCPWGRRSVAASGSVTRTTSRSSGNW